MKKSVKYINNHQQPKKNIKKILIIVSSIILGLAILSLILFLVIKLIINNKIEEGVEELRKDLIEDNIEGHLVTEDKVNGQYIDSDIYVLEITREYFSNEYSYKTYYVNSYNKSISHYITYDFYGDKIKKYCNNYDENEYTPEELKEKVMSDLQAETGWDDEVIAKCDFKVYEFVESIKFKIIDFVIDSDDVNYKLLIYNKNDEFETYTISGQLSIIADNLKITYEPNDEKINVLLEHVLNLGVCKRQTYQEKNYYSVIYLNSNIILKAKNIS